MLKVHSYETFATQDGPGIRLVIFLQGCLFRCQYCHNPDTIPTEGGKEMSAEDILALAIKQKEYFAKKGGITFSGGEPLLQAKELLPVVKLLKTNGFHVCIDTNGYVVSEEARAVLNEVDMVLPDIKHINLEKHEVLVGKSNKNSLGTVQYLDEIQKPYWIRYVLVPGHTDNEEDLRGLGEFLQNLKHLERIELLPYHNLGKHKWDQLGWKYPLEGLHASTLEDLGRAKAILNEYTDKVFIRG